MDLEARSSGDTAGLTEPRVVVGVDGSSLSMRALAWAAEEARLRGAVLEVVHVDFCRQEVLEALAPGLIDDEQVVLERAVARAKALAPGILVVGRICDPPPGRALIEASEGAEMLIVGSRGLGVFRELTMGSVSSECAHGARCPVAIIHPAVSSRVAPHEAKMVGASGNGCSGA